MLFLWNEVFMLWTFVHISAVRVFAKTDSRVSQSEASARITDQ